MTKTMALKIFISFQFIAAFTSHSLGLAKSFNL